MIAVALDGTGIVMPDADAMANAGHFKVVAGNSMIAAADRRVRKKWALRKECG